MQTRPHRSILFVPATRERWLRGATELDADAIIIDLEDAVADDAKDAARAGAAAALQPLADAAKDVFVRINAVSTPHWLEDLRAIVGPGLTGVALPKVYDAGEIATVDHVIGALEGPAGLPAGSVDIQPLLETARGIHDAPAILAGSPRIRSYFGGSARDGDMSRELGSTWTRDGEESLFVRSKLLLDGRAAGIPYPVSGTWTDLDDDDGLRAFAAQSRLLGYVGMYVIHPSHVPIVNETFTPSEQEVAHQRAIIAAFDEAQAAGQGSVRLDDVMVDRAMAERARALLALAGALEGTS